MITVHRNAALTKPRTARNLFGPVQATKVHPNVLTVALELANGDARRLLIRPGYVIVRNAA